jgi:arylsulfatase A-like enzyme
MNFSGERRSIAAKFAEAGWHTTLVTDDSRIANFASDYDFTNIVDISSSMSATKKRANEIAESIEQTQAALFFAGAINQLETSQSPFFLWLHTGSLGRIWDAPLEFRQQYADEDDPEPATWSEPPNRVLPENFDPDELLTITHAYAGQVSLVDQLVGSLIAAIAERGLSENTLLVCFSPRGFPLGEHYRAGPCDDALYAELTHVPLLVRGPVELISACRSQALVQPADIAASILDYCRLERDPSPAGGARSPAIGRSFLPLLRGERVNEFDRACIADSTQQHTVVTPAWSLRVSRVPDVRPPSDGAQLDQKGLPSNSKAELFVKPDDWFEVNEVSDRCGDVVDQLRIVYDEFALACESDALVVLSPLSEEVLAGID